MRERLIFEMTLPIGYQGVFKILKKKIDLRFVPYPGLIVDDNGILLTVEPEVMYRLAGEEVCALVSWHEIDSQEEFNEMCEKLIKFGWAEDNSREEVCYVRENDT